MNKNLVIVAGTCVLVGLMFFITREAFESRERAGAANSKLDTANLTIGAQQLQIDVITALYNGQTAELTEARKKDVSANSFYDVRDDHAHQLENGAEGTQVANWRRSRVPDAVKRLYEHEACANAADCYQSVRTGDALPGAGDSYGEQ